VCWQGSVSYECTSKVQEMVKEWVLCESISTFGPFLAPATPVCLQPCIYPSELMYLLIIPTFAYVTWAFCASGKEFV
jgi:hypothetical protein